MEQNLCVPISVSNYFTEAKGIKQTWLAEQLGKSFSILNADACNRRQPSIEQFFKIAKILQVDPKEQISVQER